MMRLLVDQEGVAVDEGMGHDPRDFFLHEPRAVQGRHRDLAGLQGRTDPAAPSADHLRSQPDSSGRGADQRAAPTPNLCTRTLAGRGGRGQAHPFRRPCGARFEFGQSAFRREQTGQSSKTRVFPFLADYLPDRFSCHVNGIGQRRWLMYCNRPLSQLLMQVHRRPVDNRKPEQLQHIEKYLHDERFLRCVRCHQAGGQTALAGRAERMPPGFTGDESMLYRCPVRARSM